MTEQGAPLTHRQAYVGHPGVQRRKKLPPDPDVRRAILAAASKSVREHGVRGLNVAAVLEQARLSTRAFYRHFESKDQLVEAVFVEMTRAEVLQLREKMVAAATPVEAVAAWIDGRLELAFDENVKAQLGQPSLEAQSLTSAAQGTLLEPLIEELQRGLELGVFKDIVPLTAAKSIHGVVWAATQQRRATNYCDRDEVRVRALHFCLRGLGVTKEVIEHIAADGAPGFASGPSRCGLVDRGTGLVANRAT
ncbi:TetR/AcrR family transcriptional regulator [Mycobacterium sp.]|uniref:TetR/AcrR family transcriptional regulator n=1 Tax=Mycobacterium sp. TaxID=1785 RepID=UPI0025EDE8E9|nr:TetR/AcrR family transcriptional regulator [Mycobacterium sp.]MBW0014529.1 TetR/AcrR family transcriptional regulator [Mycobacterium sp.]